MKTAELSPCNLEEMFSRVKSPAYVRMAWWAFVDELDCKGDGFAESSGVGGVMQFSVVLCRIRWDAALSRARGNIHSLLQVCSCTGWSGEPMKVWVR